VLAKGGCANRTAHYGLLTYNLLSTLYIGYLSLVGGFFGYLLWPAFALHGLLAVLLAGPAYEAVRLEWFGTPLPKTRRQIASEIVLGGNKKVETALNSTQRTRNG